ncbi:hypothetical protein PV433_30905 [Paenibacillus sp. GYB004]|uniref:hypothetical protein n=1 Tax=Paenibacillus sp. GYB004 TaxID=2994393 RepID=UPI002F969E96
MSQAEITKDIVVAAIQNGLLPKIPGTIGEEAAKQNAENIAEFYKTIYKTVLNPHD